jgi:DMSO reductase anchor subunit
LQTTLPEADFSSLASVALALNASVMSMEAVTAAIFFITLLLVVDEHTLRNRRGALFKAPGFE